MAEIWIMYLYIIWNPTIVVPSREYLRKYPNAKIVTNAKTVTYIKQFFDFENIDEKIVVVKEGETLSTGKHNFAFVLAPMVHWPEVMVSFDTDNRYSFLS